MNSGSLFETDDDYGNIQHGTMKWARILVTVTMWCFKTLYYKVVGQKKAVIFTPVGGGGGRQSMFFEPKGVLLDKIPSCRSYGRANLHGQYKVIFYAV